jgi:hypothetical protein
VRHEKNDIRVGKFLSRIGLLLLPAKIEQTAKRPAKLPENPKSSHRFVTTADAKIPLSVGQVKQEPQYVVFSSPYTAPSSAIALSVCAKRESPRKPRVLASEIRNSGR